MIRKFPLILSFSLIAATPAIAGNWNVPTAAHDLANPIPVDGESIPKASQVYEQHCIACHGREGLGDGTKEQVEYSIQSILSVPTQPGNQPLTDGELYWKITHGVGKMPAFAGKLTDTERWLVVNHLRSLPPVQK